MIFLHLVKINISSSKPNKIQFEIQLAKKTDLSIVVVDENSREVFSEGISGFTGSYSNEIDLSKLTKGTYFLKISANGKSISKSIFIN